MQGIGSENGGMRYLLTVIDVFFKFAWSVPVHLQDAKALTAAFGQVLKTANPCHPKCLQTDKGNEFFLLELPDPDETPRYPALCQWERTKGGRGKAIQSNDQNKDMDIFVGPRHRALGRYHPGLGWRQQQLAPPLHRHGAGRCPEEGRELPLGALFGDGNTTFNYNSASSHGAGQQAQQNFW